MAITWKDRADLGDVEVSAMVLDDATFSIGFRRYPRASEDGRFFDMGFHFTADDIAKLADLFQRMQSENRKEAPVIVAGITVRRAGVSCGSEPSGDWRANGGQRAFCSGACLRAGEHQS